MPSTQRKLFEAKADPSVPDRVHELTRESNCQPTQLRSHPEQSSPPAPASSRIPSRHRVTGLKVLQACTGTPMSSPRMSY